jgi:hypothetical protein
MRARLFASVVIALTIAGCGDDFTGPEPSTLRVSVTTSGVDADADGYRITVGTKAPRIQLQGTVSLSMTPGRYDVLLDDVAANCTVEGPAEVSVIVPPPPVAPIEVPQVSFQVTCHAASAAVRVIASSSGRDFPPAGYQVHLSNGSTVTQTLTAYANVPLVVEGLPAGSYAVTLSDLSDNCTLSGPNTRTVSVTIGGVTRDIGLADFAVACAATTGDVNLSTTTTGTHRDINGYTLMLDGELVTHQDCSYFYYYCDTRPTRFQMSGAHLFQQLAPGDHIFELTDIASTCSVNGPNPATVSVTLGAVSELTFTVACN